jgi:hypothetical protein
MKIKIHSNKKYKAKVNWHVRKHLRMTKDKLPKILIIIKLKNIEVSGDHSQMAARLFLQSEISQWPVSFKQKKKKKKFKLTGFQLPFYKKRLQKSCAVLSEISIISERKFSLFSNFIVFISIQCQRQELLKLDFHFLHTSSWPGT